MNSVKTGPKNTPPSEPATSTYPIPNANQSVSIAIPDQRAIVSSYPSRAKR